MAMAWPLHLMDIISIMNSVPKGIMILGVALLTIASVFGYRFYLVQESISDGYALLQTASLIISYLRTHNDEWPRSWSELSTTERDSRGSPKGLKMRTGSDGGSFKGLEHRVVVDFTVNTDKLLRSQSEVRGPVPKVVHLRNRRIGNHRGIDPNLLIVDYLQRKH